MEVTIEPTWKEALKDEFALPYFGELHDTVREMYLGTTPVYPPPKLVFNAFELCPFDAVKVVILGQDPYHGPGQAHGLSFSVQEGTPFPPSLRNIYKELQDDIPVLSKDSPCSKQSGDLSPWAKQGVLLLNATLTVNAHQAGSHQGIGWERFTDAVIQKLSEEKEHLVFILWGRYAQEKGRVIDETKHCVLKSAHPSPLSAYNGFFGSKPFSATNSYLQEHEYPPIVW
jgi:uracil-DNA glycosylase